MSEREMQIENSIRQQVLQINGVTHEVKRIREREVRKDGEREKRDREDKRKRKNELRKRKK